MCDFDNLLSTLGVAKEVNMTRSIGPSRNNDIKIVHIAFDEAFDEQIKITHMEGTNTKMIYPPCKFKFSVSQVTRDGFDLQVQRVGTPVGCGWDVSFDCSFTVELGSDEEPEEEEKVSNEPLSVDEQIALHREGKEKHEVNKNESEGANALAQMKAKAKARREAEEKRQAEAAAKAAEAKAQAEAKEAQEAKESEEKRELEALQALAKQADEDTAARIAAGEVCEHVIGTSKSSLKYAQIKFAKPYDHEVEIIQAKVLTAEGSFELNHKNLSKAGFTMTCKNLAGNSGWENQVKVSYAVVKGPDASLKDAYEAKKALDSGAKNILPKSSTKRTLSVTVEPGVNLNFQAVGDHDSDHDEHEEEDDTLSKTEQEIKKQDEVQAKLAAFRAAKKKGAGRDWKKRKSGINLSRKISMINLNVSEEEKKADAERRQKRIDEQKAAREKAEDEALKEKQKKEKEALVARQKKEEEERKKREAQAAADAAKLASIQAEREAAEKRAKKEEERLAREADEREKALKAEREARAKMLEEKKKAAEKLAAEKAANAPATEEKTREPTPRASASPRRATASDFGDNCLMLFDAFKKAADLYLINETFTFLKEESIALHGEKYNDDPYDCMKAAMGGKFAYKRWWKMLDSRKNHAFYKTGALKGKRVVVAGGGPSGLRVAIEARLMGAETWILEKRSAFNRNNILHIWDSSISDLRGLGAQFFLKDFATGSINHVSIREMQCVLLKSCLALGCNFVHDVQYNTTLEPKGGGGYVVQVRDNRKGEHEGSCNDEVLDGYLDTHKYDASKHDCADDPNMFYIPCDILIGADGARGGVAKDGGITKCQFQGGEAIGLTCNFVNMGTPAEKTLPEFTCSKVYNRDFFQMLETKYKLKTENLVYYHGNFTHYLVMTPRRVSLNEKGVFKENKETVLDCLLEDNIDREQLQNLCREVADELTIPRDTPWAKNFRGQKDVAIFDFSGRKMAETPASRKEKDGHELVTALVGDALLEPFWPLGTGANKAVLSALDTAWMLLAYYSNNDWDMALKMRKTCYRVMRGTMPSSLPSPGNCLSNINPQQHYLKKDLK